MTKPKNTEYTPTTWESQEVIFVLHRITFTAKPTPHTFDRSALQQQLPTIFSLHLLNPSLTNNQFWVGPQAPQPFICPFVYQHTCTTLGFTHAHNQTNRVSGVDSRSLWAYPGVLSDTLTECATQCANVIAETNTRHHANHALSRIRETKCDTTYTPEPCSIITP